MKKIIFSILAIFSLALPAFGQASFTVPSYTAGYRGTTAATQPTLTPGTGSYSGTQTVTISSTSGTIECYNTSGSPATNGAGTACTTGTLINTNSGTSCVGSHTVCGDITVSASETVYAVAGSASLADSAVASATYTISAGPTIAAVGTPACASAGFVGSVTISPTIHASGDQLFITASLNTLFSTTITSILDNGGSGGSTYHHPTGFPQLPTSGSAAGDEWYTLSLASGVTTITVNFGGSGAIAEVCAQEYSGGVSVNATTYKGEQGTGGVGPTSYTFTQTVSSGSFLIASIASDRGGGTGLPTATSGTIRIQGNSGGSTGDSLQDNSGSTSLTIAGGHTSSGWFDYTAIELENH